MKKIIFPLILFFSFILCSTAFSQLSNVKVNSSDSSFSIISGNNLSWSYNVGTPGDTTLVEIWIDVDGNGHLNTSTDVLWAYFNQIDGDSLGQSGGPPDIDGSENGQVTFSSPIGLAPGKYILEFKSKGTIVLRNGTVTALSSPAFTISGKITTPAGISPANIVVHLAANNSNEDIFWTGITNANGNYTIEMNSDTSGNPWKLEINNRFILWPAVQANQPIYLTIDSSISTSYSNNNFTFDSADAVIDGYVKDGNGNPAISYVNINDPNNRNFYREVQTDTTGYYRIGMLTTDGFPLTNLNIGLDNGDDTTLLNTSEIIPLVNTGTKITKDFFVLKDNSTISGRITIQGNAPKYMIEVYAMNSDSGSSTAYTNDNGYYTVKVSNKIYNYTIYLDNSVSGYNFTNPVAHPGDKNVNINLSVTGIEQTKSSMPKDYSLSQNYPNPFNPSTEIKYSLPNESSVRIIVYNLIGQKISELVNGTQTAGYHEVTFNANNLSSGIYFYKIVASAKNSTKEFISTKKMLLLK